MIGIRSEKQATKRDSSEDGKTMSKHWESRRDYALLVKIFTNFLRNAEDYGSNEKAISKLTSRTL